MESLRRALFAPVDAGSVVLFRIAFGVLLCFDLFRYLAKGWVKDNWVTPTFHFTYFGFDWVAPLPGPAMYMLFLVLLGAAAGIAVGLFYRVAAATFALGYTYVFLIDQTYFQNHFYLVCLFAFLLWIIPAHVDGSFDAIRRPEIRSRTLPAWTLWLLRFQLGVVYFYGGIAKLNADWFRGQPLTMWLAQDETVPAFLRLEGVGLHMSWAGLLIDLLIVPALLWSRTRTAALIVITSFHLLNARIFDIGIFPWFALTMTFILFTPNPRLEDDGEGDGEPVKPPFPWLDRVRQAETSRIFYEGRQRLVLGFLAFYVTLQLLIPLRHHLYPGHVHWTEEAHLFSWFMKLRQKKGGGAFFVVTPDEEFIKVDGSKYLTNTQRETMVGRPDMILQFAKFLAEEHAEFGDVQVRAVLFVSLNDYEAQRFVDPEVDLSRQPRTLGHADWILPFEAKLEADQ